MKKLMLMVFALLAFSGIFAVVSSAALNDGLVAWYPFNGNANDESGNGRHGELRNNPQFVSGVSGQALHLQGAGFMTSIDVPEGDCVNLPHIYFNSMNQYTISLWVKEEGMSHEHGEAYIFFGDHTYGSVSIAHFSDNLYFSINADSYLSKPFPSGNVNSWCLYTLVYDNGHVKAYQNGQLIGELFNQVTSLPPYSGAIARHWWANGAANSTRFIGSIDDVRIYNRALSEDEILSLYSGISSTFDILTVTKSGDGSGAITSSPAGINCGNQCTAVFEQGTSVTLTAQAGDGSTFTGWSGAECSGTGACTVTLNTDTQVTASFVQKAINSLQVTVYDEKTGLPLEGATVSLDSQNLSADIYGVVLFSNLSAGQYNLTVLRTGYNAYQGAVVSITAGLSKKIVSLSPVVVAEKPVVTDVVSSHTNRGKKAFFLDRINFDLNFYAAVNWNGRAPGLIHFITPLGTYAQASANRNFNMGQDFGPGGRLQVVAVSADGTQSDPFDANIEVMPWLPAMLGATLKPSDNGFSYEFHLTGGSVESIISRSSKAVPSDIPLFGGKEFSFGAVAEYEVVVGSDGIATYTLVAKKSEESGLKMFGKSFDLDGAMGGDIEFSYKESSKAWHLDGGHVTFDMEANYGVGPAYMVVPVGPIPVPVYVRGEVGPNFSAALGVTGLSEETGCALEGTFEPGAAGKAIAGAGIASALSVEGYLGIDASMLFSFPTEPFFREASIALSGGITVTALFYQHEKPLWEYQWGWVNETSSPFSDRSTMAMSLQNIQNGNFKPLPRKYGSGIMKQMIDVQSTRERAEAAGEETIPGQTNIYPYSYPQVVSLGGDLLLTWITDDLSKTANNRTSLSFSRFNGSWSEPAVALENGTADFYPSLAATTEGAVLAWQDSGMVFGDGATLEDILPQQEISVALYSTASGAWSAPVRLSENTHLDRTPLVAADGNAAVAVWVSNEQNDLTGSAEKPNNLNYAFFNGTLWTPSGVMAAGLGAIVKSALVYRGGNATYVFAADADGDLSTVNDQDLYLMSYDGAAWSSVTRLTETAVQNANPQLQHDATGDLLLVWYQDGNYRMAKNLDMANAKTIVSPGLSSGAADFRLATGAGGQLFIVWPDASKTGQDIYMSPYDPILDVWGKGTRLTDTEGMKRSIAAVQQSDGTLSVVYNKVETVMTSRNVDVNGKNVVVQVPAAGTTDLCVTDFSIEGDMAVQAGSITISPQQVTAGGTLTISAMVVNAGLKPAENIGVDFYYGDPANGGVLMGARQTIVGPLAAGDAANVTLVGWSVPVTPENKDIYMIVDPDLTYGDKDRSNNIQQLTFFKPDLAITQITAQKVGPVRRAITVQVTNTGFIPASAIPLSIYQPGPQGSIIYQETIDSLAVNETRIVVYEWDATGVAADDNDNVKIYAVVNKDQTIAETGYLNNSRYLQLPRAAQNVMIDPGTTPAQSEAGKQITISGTNFGAIQGNGYVDFNGVRGTIISWSNTSIVVVVPSDAVTGCLRVVTDLAESGCYDFTLVTAYQLEVALRGSGTGDVSSEPSGIACGGACAASFDAGTNVTLTATASGDSVFAGWTDDCTGKDTCVVTMSQARSVTATFTKPVLYAAYPDAGIWKNNGNEWTQITTGAPDLMVTSGTDLYATFAGGGIWKYNGSDWSQATSNNPDKMVVSGTTLYGTFTGNGIWKFDGTNWSQVTSNNPDEMVIAGGSLYGTFGISGIWKYDGSDWSQVTTNTPAQMVGTTNALYGIFAGAGIWKYEGSEWTQVTSNTPDQIISGGTSLYGTFAGSGIWKYNGTDWANVTPNNPQQMTATSSAFYGVFTGTGIWKHDGTTWSQVTANDPLKMVAGE